MRVLVQIPQALARVAEEFPDVEVIDISADDPPPGTSADAFFGGWGDWDRVVRLLRETGVSWFQLSGTGIDGVPAALFDAVPLVTCARGASSVPISEYVIASMLAFEKQLPGNWLVGPPKHWNFQRMDSIAGKTVGLVGLGGIGARIARVALALDMRVLGVRRHPEAGSPVDGIELVRSLDAVLPEADHLVLAVPATPNTQRLLDADAFTRVKPGVHLVNIARGVLVDQDALRAALDDGRVARATLDTVDPEPLPEGHWMYDHPGVFLTPHSSWSSTAFFTAATDIFCENLRLRLAGEPLVHTVDPEEGY